MNQSKLLLKYSVRQHSEQQLHYRARLIDISDFYDEFHAMKSFLNGMFSIADVATKCDISMARIHTIVSYLKESGAVVEVSQDFDKLCGEKCFWLLENELCEYRFYGKKYHYRPTLPNEIIRGDAPLEVVKGFLVETAFLLRNVPSELAFAINNSYDEEIRSQYVKFFTSEYNHGEIIFNKMKLMLDEQTLLRLTPLPATLGLLNTYRWLATDTLYYATALIHDEGCSFDSDSPEENIMHQIIKNYPEIPHEIPEIFLWHENLDKLSEHGFFTLDVFKKFDYIDEKTLKKLKEIILMLLEMQGMLRSEISRYYSLNSVNSRDF